MDGIQPSQPGFRLDNILMAFLPISSEEDLETREEMVPIVLLTLLPVGLAINRGQSVTDRAVTTIESKHQLSYK